MNPHSRTQRVNPYRNQRSDQRARKTVRSAVILLLVVLAGITLYRWDVLDKLSSASQALDRAPHDDTAELARQVRDVPDCAKYRAAILAQQGKKGDAADYEKTRAFEAAKKDRCLKLDVE